MNRVEVAQKVAAEHGLSQAAAERVLSLPPHSERFVVLGVPEPDSILEEVQVNRKFHGMKTVPDAYPDRGIVRCHFWWTVRPVETDFMPLLVDVDEEFPNQT